MKKQLIIVVLMSFWAGEVLTLTPGQEKILRNNPGRVIAGMTWNGTAIVPATSENTSGNSTGSTVPTKSQMEAAVAANPQAAAAACQAALGKLGVSTNGNPDSTVLNYIMG